MHTRHNLCRIMHHRWLKQRSTRSTGERTDVAAIQGIFALAHDGPDGFAVLGGGRPHGMRLLGPSNVAAPESRSTSSSGAKIVGRGEMADRIRNFNWALTGLGSLDRWSPELLSLVNLVLSCPTPARLLWGPDLVLIYNDS